MLAKLTTLLVVAAVCLAFPAEELRAPPVAPSQLANKQPVVPPVGPEGASDLQTDNTFWYGGGHHHHHYPVYRSYYIPRTYSYETYYEPYGYSSWW